MESAYKNISPAIRNSVILLTAVILLLSLNGCSVSYSFSGASIPPQVKTINVQYFTNRANLVQPGLSQLLTEALIDKCKAQTNLSMINGTGDVSFEGEITDYNTLPLTVGADASAAMNRFTITIKVRFKNTVDPTLSYDQTFSRYKDYDSNKDLSQVEKQLSIDIVELLVEDIFNQAFVNW
jgi:hypothetical protein